MVITAIFCKISTNTAHLFSFKVYFGNVSYIFYLFSIFCYTRILIFAAIIVLLSMLGTFYIEDMYASVLD